MPYDNPALFILQLKIVFLNQFQKLAHLIWFCLTLDVLKIYKFSDLCLQLCHKQQENLSPQNVCSLCWIRFTVPGSRFTV